MACYAIRLYRRGYRVLVALNEQRELLAACWFVRHNNYLYCPAFATRRELRGQGIGKAMIAELRAIADADGGQVVIAAELGSVALWQCWGFCRCRKGREDKWAWALDAEYGVFIRASTQLMLDKTRAEVAYRERCWDQYYSGCAKLPVALDAASVPLGSRSSSPPSAPPLAAPSVAPPSAAPSTCQPAASRDPPLEAGIAAVSAAAATSFVALDASSASPGSRSSSRAPTFGSS